MPTFEEHQRKIDDAQAAQSAVLNRQPVLRESENQAIDELSRQDLVDWFETF